MPCFSAPKHTSGQRVRPKECEALSRIAYLRKRSENQSVVLPVKDYGRLKKASKVISLDERLDALARQEQERKQMEEDAEKLKQKFQKIDEDRLKARSAKASSQKDDLFDDERAKTLERAFILKNEQEEEVKHVDKIILNAKCHAVRDAQLQEKHDLENERKEEENRIAKIMLDEVKRVLDEEDEEASRERGKKKKYADALRSQLNEQEKLQFIESRRIEEEGKMLTKAAEALKRDDERQARAAWERREKMREDLGRICEMSTLFKKMLLEQEKEAEMRSCAYRMQKDERDKQLAIERKVARQTFERKQQHLFTLQQKLLDSKESREEMNLLRQQEIIEREYRRKEKEAALRQKRFEKQLHETREAQLLEIRERQALEIARNEDQYNKIVTKLRAEDAKQKCLDEQRRKANAKYRETIFRQIAEKERERKRMIQENRNDAYNSAENERKRKQNIGLVIKSKLDGMRAASLPPKYIKDVEKELKKLIS